MAYAYELNLINGTSADAFFPMGTVDLAAAITLAARLHLIYPVRTPLDPAEAAQAILTLVNEARG